MTKRAVQLIPRDRFAAFDWWPGLDSRVQDAVEEKTQELAQALLAQGRSRLAMGKVLSEIRDILQEVDRVRKTQGKKRQGIFLRYLRGFRMSQRTAYRYIDGYENTAKRLPAAVLERAMMRGVDMIGDTPEKPLGVYTDAVKRLPPPPKDEAKAERWLDEVEEARRKIRSRLAKRSAQETEVDPDEALKECYRFIAIRLRRLHSGRAKGTWTRNLIGMLMTSVGMGNEQTFSPVAVPPDFRAVRGRPRLSTEGEPNTHAA